METEVQLKRGKEETVITVERKMAMIRMEMNEMTTRCEAAEEEKAHVSTYLTSAMPLSPKLCVEYVHACVQ